MKKYILFFAASSFFSISHTFAQNQAASGRGEATIVTESKGNSDNSSSGTVSKAGKNQQSIYTPNSSDVNKSTTTPAPSASDETTKQALPVKEQPATIIDPKKR